MRFLATNSGSLVVLLGLSIWSGGCARKPTSPSEAPVVYTASPAQRDVSIYSDWIGTTVGFVDAEIHSQVSGYLLSQNYKEGSLVKKGDLLFQVDPRPFQALVDQARARVEAAKTQLTEAKAETNEVKAEIDRARAALGKTELDVKRESPLVSDGTVSQQELDDAIQANLVNKASVAAAQGRYERAMAQVGTAEANVNVAQSALQGAELNLGFTRVTAPVDGIAGIRVANIGDLVGTNDRSILTSVSTIDPIFVEFPVSEQEYLTLRSLWLGDSSKTPSLQLILADGTTYPHRGVIDIVGSQVNPTTGTLRIRGLFANPGNVLRPGQYAKVRAVTGIRKAALLLPQRAIQELQGIYQVIIVDSSRKCEFRTVEVGDRIGSYWLIAKGLSPSDQVIVEGLQKVRAGETVHPESGKLPPVQFE
ncbi:MAG TPA: efflux RND transporter periplasmic adaptor subunit [Bryobacteraceae bacterium]|nr:efflux RND transporter periplasmic adaptor subunit [Bryobacteraceae bacterium]